MLQLENNRLNKTLIIHTDVNLQYIIPLLKAFIDEIQHSDSGTHEGNRKGIVYTLADNSIVYVYQTDTSIVIRQ